MRRPYCESRGSWTQGRVQPRSAGDELEHRDESGEELKETGVSVETDGEPWIGAEFDQDLFQCAGAERLRQTRRQKRLERREHAAASGPDNLEGQLNRLTASELKVLQQNDETLEAVRRAADGEQSTAGGGFFKKDGVIYRRWTPPGRDTDAMTVEQLVLPSPCRRTVLKVAHQIPLAGHLGKTKTADRVRQRFYWPSLFKDVEEFCRSCGECQKCSTRRGPRAPMVPLPVMEEPFQRIVMDVAGPLPRSRSGNRYILVVCDYATRYPEAFALKSVDAENVAEALMTMFSRVGVPKEILTDRGTNFTSKLLAELYRLLQVKAVRTSPYHPQTDSLVERFNRTLKNMLRKTVTDEGKDWDRLLPYVLFAYREVPQSSTGFSPSELLYGRAVRGPLDVLRESWEGEKQSDESVVSYILSVQEKLAKMSELVGENATRAKAQQKKWYDQNARSREFQPGEQILVLLPTSTSKLLAQWQGSYPIVRRIGAVNYEVDMVGQRKRRRIFHVNMLRKWYVPTATSYLSEEVGVGADDDVVLWREDYPDDDKTPIE